MKAEKWNDITGYEGIYMVSSYGNIKSLDRKVKTTGGSIRTSPGKKISPALSTSGYHFVWLHKNGVRLIHQVHRLVCAAFNNNEFNKETVNHINGIKTDNRAENLEWATHKEQTAHAIHIGRLWKPGRKLSDTDVIKIRELYKQGGHTQKQIGKMYGVEQSSIGSIIRKQSYPEL